jgi:hypothetical protein
LTEPPKPVAGTKKKASTPVGEGEQKEGGWAVPLWRTCTAELRKARKRLSGTDEASVERIHTNKIRGSHRWAQLTRAVKAFLCLVTLSKRPPFPKQQQRLIGRGG